MNRSARSILGVFVVIAGVFLYYAKHSNHSSPPQNANRTLAAPVTQASAPANQAESQPVTSASAKTLAPQKKISTTAAQTAPATGGLVAVIDPETGQLRQADATDIAAATAAPAPTGLQRRALTLAPKVAEVQTFEAPGGATGAILGDDSMAFMVVTKTPDGKLSTDCVQGKNTAEAKVRAGNRAKKKTQAVTHPAQKETLDEM